MSMFMFYGICCMHLKALQYAGFVAIYWIYRPERTDIHQAVEFVSSYSWPGSYKAVHDDLSKTR